MKETSRLCLLAVGAILLLYFCGFLNPYLPPRLGSDQIQTWIFEGRSVSLEEILANPSRFNGKHVAVKGILVRYIGQHWGEDYSIYPSLPTLTKDTVHIALAFSSGAKPSDSLVRFTYDGVKFEKQLGPEVAVEGIFRDQGLVVDAPRYFIEVLSIEADTKGM